MNLSEVQAYYKACRETYPEPFRLRIHRALSWLDKAQQAQADLDIRVQALWIAFNAAYANEIDGRTMLGDRGGFRCFLQTVCSLDKEKRIYGLVWQTFHGAIRSLLDNRYVFQPFWDFHNGLTSEASWRDDFDRAKKKVHTALSAQDTDTVLLVLFDRLYTLRNQIIHGGATYGSSANRSQLRDACNILSALLPEILQVMQLHSSRDWGRPFYPFVKDGD